MATKIKIGHASWSENQSATGQAGDQNSREVCINENYDIVSNLKPTVVLRPKKQTLAEKSAKACEAACSNDNIGYSQNSRNTLYSEAVKVNYDLSKITTKCNTDCTAFVAVCAIAGGATFKYGSNGPTTPTIRQRFTESGDYTALTDDKHLKSSDYLKRGDVLVNEKQHAVMVLSSGSEIRESSSISLDLKLTSVETNKVFVTGRVLEIENGIKKTLADKSWLKLYKWTYKIEPLSNKNEKAITKELKVTSNSTSFSLTNLKPNSSYALYLTATQLTGADKLSSPSIIFTTLEAIPDSVKNLAIKLDDNNDLTKKKCKITFDAPSSWNNSALSGAKKGYRTSLVINGKVVAFNDNLIKSPINGQVSKTIQLSDLTKNKVFGYNDTLQIGIQTWLKDGQNKLIFGSPFPKCSQPVYIKYFIKSIDKAFIKTETGFKRTLIHNNIRGVY